MAKVTFNKNDIQLSFNDTLERINLPGVTAGGESGPWKNGTKITDVCGTAETAVIYWCPGPPGTPAKEPTTVNVIQPNKFPEGWQLHTTGTSILHGHEHVNGAVVLIYGVEHRPQT